MDRARFRRLIDAVGEAVERPAAEREAFLADACADDPALLDEARALVAEAAGTSLASVTSRLASAVDRAAADTMAEEGRPPERIGRYRIIRTLGRGGMGVVYLARQDEPLRRNVALKVIRPGLADRETMARFAAERQALARMDHPAIARVFDAGTTDDGLPYFVMELVGGVPLTEYCEREELGLDARLDLFRTVCDAVHHAHLRGIIHRDLKPSNVLVATVDGHPAPKVIDFGIAKPLEGMLSGESFHTRDGALIGTVDYMSPEQIRGGAGGVDVRSDVYSLGVILYQLVTGRHPFHDTTLRRAGLLEAQRIILETDPPRPSRTVGPSSGPEGGVEGARGRRLRPRFRQDLDWVVMKALEKDRERRYQSALDLARDLERYASDRPVTAGPPGLPYRAAKFARRHRVGVTAAALIALALLSGTTAATRGFMRATVEAQRAEAISGFLTGLLSSVRPGEQGRAVTVREVLDDARTRLLAGEFADDLETEASLALVIGHSFEGLGEYDVARELIQHSVEVRRGLHSPEDRRVFASLYRLGTVLWKQGALEEALALRLDLADLTERIFGTAHLDHAESLSNLGNTYADLGDLDRAEDYLRQAVDVGRRVPAEEGELDLARFLNNLGTVYFDQEDFRRAAEVLEESLEIRERRLGEENYEYVITLRNVGNTQLNLGNLEEAEATLRHVVLLEERIFGEDHPQTAYAYSALSEALHRQGRSDVAEEYARRTVAIRVATADSAYWRVASARRNLAEVLMALGRMDEAEAELRTAWEGLTAAGETSRPQARDVAEAMAGLQSTLGVEPESR